VISSWSFIRQLLYYNNLILWTTVVYAVRPWPKGRYAVHDCNWTSSCYKRSYVCEY